MAGFDDVVIISGCRTPVGKFQGSLSDLSAPQLGAFVVREAVKDYADRVGRLSEAERLRMLAAIDTIIKRKPTRPQSEVDAELRAIRAGRRTGGRRHRA